MLVFWLRLAHTVPFSLMIIWVCVWKRLNVCCTSDPIKWSYSHHWCSNTSCNRWSCRPSNVVTGSLTLLQRSPWSTRGSTTVSPFLWSDELGTLFQTLPPSSSLCQISRCSLLRSRSIPLCCYVIWWQSPGVSHGDRGDLTGTVSLVLPLQSHPDCHMVLYARTFRGDIRYLTGLWRHQTPTVWRHQRVSQSGKYWTLERGEKH